MFQPRLVFVVRHTLVQVGGIGEEMYEVGQFVYEAWAGEGVGVGVTATAATSGFDRVGGGGGATLNHQMREGGREGECGQVRGVVGDSKARHIIGCVFVPFGLGKCGEAVRVWRFSVQSGC